MTTDVTTKIIPGHGAIFIAPANTALPATPLTAFTLTGAAPAGWENLGHTSKDNLPAFGRDGGDKSVLDSWLADGIATVYAPTSWTLGINPIQVDKNSLDLGFGGNFDTDGGYIVPGTNTGAAKALVLLMTDGTATMLFYMPNTSVVLGDVPSLDTTKFLEIPLSATILTADTAVIPATTAGMPGIMKIYKTSLVRPVPAITTALPASKGVGDVVTLVGTGFTGATGATVGGVAVTQLDVLSDTKAYITLPAGSAGSAPIIITTLAGPSAAKAYTRT